jgi:hypothetical protein
MDLSQIGTLDKRNARRVRLEHEFQAALATLTAHGAISVSLSALLPLSVS